MRGRLTVTARRHGNIPPTRVGGQGSRCDAGADPPLCPGMSLAGGRCGGRDHWSAARTGKVRRMGPEARRPPADRNATKALAGRGWLMKLTTSGALAGLLLALAPATALAGPTVSVRVEGKDRTLLERTVVTLPDTPPPVTGGACPAGSAAAALEEATKGNWDRGSFTQVILGESHTFTNRDYWAEWVNQGNGYRLGHGICADVLNQGDELLMLADFSNASFGPTVFPLALESVPATGQAGSSVTVVVTEYVSESGDPGTGERRLVEGATVSGGGE